MNHRVVASALLALISAVASLGGQQPQPAKPAQPSQPVAKQPQPKSKGEADALMAIFNTQDVDVRIKAAEELLTKYVDTEFKTVALQIIAASYQQKNDFEKMVIYAERTLESDPDNYVAMLMLASAIPQRTREFDLDREEKLARGGEIRPLRGGNYKDRTQTQARYSGRAMGGGQERFQRPGSRVAGVGRHGAQEVRRGDRGVQDRTRNRPQSGSHRDGAAGRRLQSHGQV